MTSTTLTMDDHLMKVSTGTQRTYMRAASMAILAVVLVSSLSTVRAQNPVANDAPSDEEAVFSLDGFGNAQDTGDGTAKPGSSVLEHLSTNLRLSIDAVSRVETSRRRGQQFALNAIGIDLHRVVSSKYKDIGTLLLQPYVVRRDNSLMVMTNVEDDDGWEVEFHQFWFNLTRWGKGRTNIRFGHRLMSLLELDWSTPDQKLSAYAQAVYFGQRGPKGWDENVLARIGAVWSLNEDWSASGQYSQDIKTYGTRPEDAIFTLQMRYRFLT